jgi:hypothetical protein
MLALYEEGRKIKEIAAEVGMCTQSVTLLLRERFATLGRTMPDGRTRRAAHQRGQHATNDREVGSDEPPASQ